MDPEKTTQRIELGRGRSGVVFQGRNNIGRDIAIKVFSEDLITSFLHYLVSSAPNPYVWNEDAVKSAHFRRNVLKELVDYWFDSKLKIAESFGINWNNKFKAYELKTEFIEGNHASLHHPLSKQREGELTDLMNDVMKPLQERLVEAGFDGSAWQAGKGNPTASSNFLLEKSKNDCYKWVMVDLESGVPALNLLSPISFFSFYLPKLKKYRHALFDDVDINKLRDYINTHKKDLESRIGFDDLNFLSKNVNKLEFHQKKWKSMKRVDNGIIYQLKKGKISKEKANFYSKHPLQWYGKEFKRLSLGGYTKLVGDLPWEIFNRITLVDYKELASKTWRFVSSQKHKIEVIRNYIGNRIDAWEKRSQLKKHEANYLHNQLEREVTSPYLTDFMWHVSIKPVEIGFGAFVIPLLYASGKLDLETSIWLEFWGGSITRTAYTLSRMMYSTMKPNNLRKLPSNIEQFFTETYKTTVSEGFKKGFRCAIGKILGIKRIIALGVGLVPTFGNAAYPLQGIYSSFTENKELFGFMIYDISSKTGEKIPILGGRNSLTEHFFNKLPDLFVKDRNPDKCNQSTYKSRTSQVL